MATSYIRCFYSSPTSGIQCEVMYAYEDGGSKFCPHHSKGATVESTSQLDDATIFEKRQFIDQLNSFRAECATMSLEELDAHIAQIESVIEHEKTKLFAARGTKQAKWDALDGEERSRRSKILVEATQKKEPYKPKTTEQKLMKQLGAKKSKFSVKDLLNLDIDELLAKSNKKDAK